jgi:hypothetical protein
MLKEIEVRFATKTYEYINAKFDGIPTDKEYQEAKEFAEKHKNNGKKQYNNEMFGSENKEKEKDNG